MNLSRLLPLASLLMSMQLHAASTITQTAVVSSVIPDNDDIGYVSTQTITDLSFGLIQTISVNLEISGGWNGDLYAYLSHDSGFAVLLNRAGKSAGSPDGAASSGMTITLSDTAGSDVHTGLSTSGTNVTGVFQPDGRETDPLTVLDSDSRTAMLSSFTGNDPNGEWTLFIADQAVGSVSTLESWTLTVSSVPEPSGISLLALGFVGLIIRRKRG